MLKIESILEKPHILKILTKKWLIIQYKKSKINILNWVYTWNNLKYKKPKQNNILYFRINKQFRALSRLDNGVLIVFNIDNHQN